MGLIIDLYAKISGWSDDIMELLPLLGALGSLFSVGASVLTRVSSAQNVSEVFKALHPTPSEVASVSLSVGLLKSHFNHQENKSKVDQISRHPSIGLP